MIMEMEQLDAELHTMVMHDSQLVNQFVGPGRCVVAEIYVRRQFEFFGTNSIRLLFLVL